MNGVKDHFPTGGGNFELALDFKIDVPCVVQWSLLVFSAPTDLNRILGTELKI